MKSLRQIGGTFALGALVAGAALGALAPAASAALTSVDLSAYVRVGRHDLPEPTRTTPPAGSRLAQEASGVTYNWDTDTLFVIGDGSTSIVQVSKTGQLIDSMTLAAGSSPQGTEFYDTEGIAYLGNGQFALVEERDRQLNRFTYVPGTTLTRADVETVDLGTFVGNVGLEGFTNDPLTGGIVAVKEITPQGVFQTDVDWANGTASNGSATTVDSVNLFDPALANVLDLADVLALSNLRTLTGPARGNLLLLSQESGQIVQVDRSGAITSTLTIVSDPGNPLSVADQQHEGLTMDDDGTLYVVNENGGGDIDHPQLWVYQPSTATNQAPTGISLANAVASLPEGTSTAARVKVADVVVADDGLGTNQLALTGADAASFELVGAALFLRAGTTLDFETKTSYAVTVTVDDTTVGSTPDATVDYALAVTDVNEAPGSPLQITEVAPWASGNAPYAADWFELTNTGSAPVDLTGWKIDDSSNAFGSAVALRGVTSIPAGGSAIFVEGLADGSTDEALRAAFSTAWYGSATPPAGVQIGACGGSGVGLSTGGDAVNVFDATGARVTGVAFGASPTASPFASFDNAAGQGSATLPLPVLATSSTRGVAGAFLAADAGEVGSPGTTRARVAITEVAPWASGNSPYAADWFELTNTGSLPVDLTGWRIDDNSNNAGAAVALRAVASIPAGGSAVFLEGEGSGAGDATLLANFATAWLGAPTLPAGVVAGTYGGAGVGLGTGGDAVNVFDATGARITGVAFGVSTVGISFDNAAGAGSTALPLPELTTLSARGSRGAFQAADGIEVGSPGAIAARGVIVSEVAPWASGNSPYAADWFELTNTGPVPVDLAGWKVDDNSNALGSAVVLRGVATIPVGRSAVFVEGVADGSTDAALAASFSTTWFGSPTLPAGVRVGGYGGSGVGLSTGGDAVNVFEGAGARVTGVAFGASPAAAPFASFDNAAGSGSQTLPLPPIATLSAIGVNGAFQAAGDTEVGSPGRIANQRPTVELRNAVAAIAEDASTAARIPVADVVVTDDPVGANVLALTGADASSFELDAGVLYLRAGIALDFETKASYAVDVTVDDATIAGAPDGAASLALQVTDVNEPASSAALQVAVSSLAEDASTAARIRLADVAVVDDALGTNALALTGADAASFELDGGALYLRAGTALDVATKASYAVAVTVDDPALGTGPEFALPYGLTVTNVNESPTARDDGGFTANQRTPESIPVASVLANDGDPDAGTTLIVVPNGFSNVVGGTVALVGSTIVFTPRSTFSGQARFTYTASDGVLASSAVVRIEVGVTVQLGNRDNRFDGTPGDDVVAGGRGDDALNGNAGDDVLAGERGDDVLTGGAGRDTFVLQRNGHGTDRIRDFAVGVDRIALAGGIRLSQLRLVATSVGTAIRYDGDTIAVVVGVTPGQLTAASFVVV